MKLYAVERSSCRILEVLVAINHLKPTLVVMCAINNSWLLAKLQEEQEKTPCVIVYCQRLADCSDLYGVFEEGMEDRDNGTERKKRLHAMYHSSTDDSIMEHIHNFFSQEDRTVRVLFLTVAFGMGVDVKDLPTHRVVKFGLPEGTHIYMQETSRAGRQGEEFAAVLMHHSKAFVIRKPSKAMKEYVGNESICHINKFLQDFSGTDSSEPYHAYTCCDVCDK
ncbi:uncharacterized protein [Amphiura filiformis]|uniref:uncharacterized protein n=1 Tax=Amphiura filiformis TaxID=82378 RepID=UPI003B2248EA